MVSLPFVVMVLLLGLVARWVIQAFGERGNPELEARHTAEIARLREEVDQLNSQVLRLTEEQSFLTRLLSEGATGADAGRLPPAPAAPPDESNPETT